LIASQKRTESRRSSIGHDLPMIAAIPLGIADSGGMVWFDTGDGAARDEKRREGGRAGPAGGEQDRAADHRGGQRAAAGQHTRLPSGRGDGGSKGGGEEGRHETAVAECGLGFGGAVELGAKFGEDARAQSVGAALPPRLVLEHFEEALFELEVLETRTALL
jgi:hypothetical protein